MDDQVAAAAASSGAWWTWWTAGGAAAVLLLLAAQGVVFALAVLVPRLRTLYPARRKPPQIRKSEREMQQLLSQDESLKTETLLWLNALLLRLWVENHKTGAITERAARIVKEELVDVKRTKAGLALNAFKLADIAVGTAAPTLKNIAVVCRQTQDSDLTVFVDLSFTGGLAFVADIELIFGIPLSLMVHIKEISGRLVVYYTEKPVTTLSFGFLGDPVLDLDVETLLAQTHFSLLDGLVKIQARNVLRKKFMLPQFKTRFFGNAPPQPPYPWEVDYDEDRMRNWKPPVDTKESSEAASTDKGKTKTSFDLSAWKRTGSGASSTDAGKGASLGPRQSSVDGKLGALAADGQAPKRSSADGASVHSSVSQQARHTSYTQVPEASSGASSANSSVSGAASQRSAKSATAQSPAKGAAEGGRDEESQLGRGSPTKSSLGASAGQLNAAVDEDDDDDAAFHDVSAQPHRP